MAVAQRSIEEAVAEPEQLGSYELLEAIGHGRVGTVFKACVRRAGKPDKLFAIKRVSAELSRDRRFADGFAAVMAHAAQLDHPAHCAIEDIDVAADGTPFVAMELVSGKDLGRVARMLVERGATMPAPLVAYIGTQIADALWAAHSLTSSGKRAPLYHGELAPSDILIGYDGSVRLTGLGAAELHALAPKLAGRPGYQGPELRTGATCDARSDVFSLGACLYELLTGTKALPTDAASSAPSAIRRPDSHITQVIPRPLEQIVSRALAEQPQARWQDASEMARALSRWCTSQSRPADAAALAAWMRELFAATSADEAERLEAWLSRIPTLGPQAVVTPTSPSGPVPRRGGWTDREERTPARGILMRKLAADMIAPEPTAEELYDEPWDLETPENQWVLSMAEAAAAPHASGVARRPGATPAVASPPAQAAQPLPPDVVPSSTWARHAPRPRWLVPVVAVAALGLLGAIVLLASHGGGQRSAIHVQSNPTGIEVFVRGQRMGITPLRRDGVPSGAARFEFRAPGFVTQTRIIELTPGEVAHLQVDLAPRAAPAIPSAPAQVLQAPASDPEPEGGARPYAARAHDDGAADRSHSHQRHGAHERDEPQAAQPGEATLVVQPAVVSATNTYGADTVEQPAQQPMSAARRPPSTQAPAPSPAALGPATVSSRTGDQPTPATATSAAQRSAAQQSAPRSVREPVPIEQSSPKVPARAKRMGVTTGVVAVEFTIDRTGAVTNATVLQADPPGVFDAAALRALSTWRYHPKLINGAPVESRQRFRFRFRFSE